MGDAHEGRVLQYLDWRDEARLVLTDLVARFAKTESPVVSGLAQEATTLPEALADE
jgi:hypothetical protein